MGKVTDGLWNIYITQETNCAETMLRAGINACGRQPSEDSRHMMAGFSGGVSCEGFCGAILGGVAAIGHELYQGDEVSFERSKQATEEFVAQCRKMFGSVDCHDIKTVWRQEESRCYQAVEKIAVILDDILSKYQAKGA